MAGRISKKCVVHYEQLITEDRNLTQLTNDTYSKLLESKDARIKLGGSNVHEKQINSIPPRFVEGGQFVHRQCYQNFTKAMSVYQKRSTSLKLKKGTQLSPLKRKRRSQEKSSILFPNVCMKCKSSRPLKVKGKKQDLRVLQTFSLCRMVKRAAEILKDDDMLLAVTGHDLIAKEFKMHPNCYKDYTRVCSRLVPTASKNVADDTLDDSEGKTDFESVSNFVQEHIINGNQSVSLKVMTEMYGFDKEDNRLRGKVKQRLLNTFGERIAFVSVSYHEAQIVISKDALSQTTLASFVSGSSNFILKEAASIIRAEIMEMMMNAPELPWPPTPEALADDKRKPPAMVKEFLTNIIHSTHHAPGHEVRLFVDSFSSDLVHAVSKGQFLTQKHVVLGAGLHSLTGQKTLIKVLGKFGHSIKYDTVRLLETAQAEAIQKLRSLRYPLPVIPANEVVKVPTFFWWDNFDCKKGSTEGSLHTTHGIAYQEETENCIRQSTEIEVERSNRRSVAVEPMQLEKRKIVPHKNPSLFAEQPESMEFNTDYADKILLLWKLMRRISSATSQTISSFVGWVILTLGKIDSKKTVITFLPPIRQPITEYSTVLECIKQSQELAMASNLTYAHITVDAGAAMKFYYIVWNNPVEFKNVIIHLGDFHAMMEFFAVIGKMIEGSGFEEVVYQSGLCSSGGLGECYLANIITGAGLFMNYLQKQLTGFFVKLLSQTFRQSYAMSPK